VAKALIKSYFDQWPRLRTFQEWVVSEVINTHVLVNPFGARLEFFGFEWDRYRKTWKLKDREEALAYMAASSVAGMIKRVGPDMRACALDHGGRLYTTTHDEYLASIPESRVDDYRKDATKIMERPWPQFGVIEGFGQFYGPTDAAVGRNWGKWHVCKPTCVQPCALYNPDGVRKVKV
jgi:DNA polymerase I-like protein with 3'-5' exonuclease and polymerase domains